MQRTVTTRLLLLAATALAVLGLAAIPLPAAAAPERAPAKVTAIPLACLLCETRVSPDGNLAAVFENRNMVGDAPTTPAMLAITLIDTQTGKPAGRLTGHTDFATDVAFTPDNTRVASLHGNGMLRLWDAKTRKLLWERQLPLGGGQLAFLPNGKTIVLSTVGLPNLFALVDAQSGAITRFFGPRFATLAEFQKVVAEPLGSLDFTYSAWALSPDGKQIVSATANDEIQLWDVATGVATQVRPPSGQKGLFNIRRIGFLPDGKSIYFNFRNPTQPQVWSLSTLTNTLEVSSDVIFGTNGLALAPDGKRFAAVDGTGDPAVQVAPVADLGAAQVVAADLPAGLRATPSTRVYFTADGKRLIVGGFAGPDGENALLLIELEA